MILVEQAKPFNLSDRTKGHHDEAVTAIWESKSESLQTQEPVLERGQMSYGIGMWLVDEGYRAKNKKKS